MPDPLSVTSSDVRRITAKTDTDDGLLGLTNRITYCFLSDSQETQPYEGLRALGFHGKGSCGSAAPQ
jgi:hypothetical protein